MRITLLGLGNTGKIVKQIALEHNYQIANIITKKNKKEFEQITPQNTDVVIDFTNPNSVCDNIIKCIKKQIPMVVGTTGWYHRLKEIKALCLKYESTIFYASNFSLGANLFFKLNSELAKIMNGFSTYNVSINESHHINKKDKPSGTAITIAENILEHLDKKRNWTLAENNTEEAKTIPIFSERKTDIKGMHTVKYSSLEDDILITHEAKNRKGFALGAILAAKFIQNKKGVFTMKDLLKI